MVKPSEAIPDSAITDLKIGVIGGGWYRLPNGEKVRGKEQAITALKNLVATTYGVSNLPVVAGGSAAPRLILRPRYPAAVSVRRPKVAILGFTDTRLQAPFGDPEFEIWGINELWRYMDPMKYGFTRWFEIHDRKAIDGDREHIEALAKFPIPVYMQQHYDDIPPSVPYPKEEVERECAINMVGAERNVYFTSSIAWMQGLAILEGFGEIHVYGVDMAQETEYFEQRPACEYLIGLAQGRGAKVYVPPTADLLKAVGQYGWVDHGDGFTLKLDERLEWLRGQRNQFQQALNIKDQERNQIIASLQQIEGAVQDCTFWRRSWACPRPVDPSKPFSDRSSDSRVNLSGDTPQEQPGPEGQESK